MRKLVLFWALLVAACSGPSQPSLAENGPGRIVSNNPCIDAILLELVPPAQIAAISHYSQRAGGSSIDPLVARRFPAIGGTAEEIIALAPDIALVGAHTPAGTLSAIRRAGIQVAVMGVADSVDASVAQVRQIGHAVKATRRAETLVTKIRRAARARASLGSEPPSLLIWQNDGLVPGPGTLFDDLMQRAGYRNAAKTYDLGMWDMLPLETVALRPPDIVLSPTRAEGATDQLRNRWLTAHKDVVRQADMPAHLLYCGGPTIIEAMALLDELRTGS